MSQPCPRCTRPLSSDAFLCTECARGAHLDLTKAADFIRSIDSKRARRGSRLWIGQGSTPAETPLPYDPRVSRAFDPVRNDLIGWARIHQDQHFDHPLPPRGLAALTLWLADHAEWAARQVWADEAFDAYASAREALEELFDSPPDREAIGECGAVIEGTIDHPCTEILAAIKGSDSHQCPRCATVHIDVKERRAALIEQAGDFTVTVSEAVKLLRTSDRDIHPRLVRAAIRFVGIVSTGDRLEIDKHGHGHKVQAFRLGSISDVLDLYESDSETKKAIRRVMRGARDTESATLSARG